MGAKTTKETPGVIVEIVNTVAKELIEKALREKAEEEGRLPTAAEAEAIANAVNASVTATLQEIAEETAAAQI